MNDEQLASDIRRAFGRYRAEPRPIESLAADSLGVGAAPGLDAGRPPLLARRRLLGGLSLAGVTVAVVMAFALTLGIAPGVKGPESAYAGWQAIPTKSNEQMRAAAPDECLTGMGEPKDMPLVVQDQRGKVGLFLFGRNGNYLSCLLIPKANGGYEADRVEISASQVYKELLEIPFGWWSTGRPSNPAFPAEITIFGMTSADRVTVHRADGLAVQATVSNGIFVAWWPGCDQAATLVAYNASGAQLASDSVTPIHDLVC